MTIYNYVYMIIYDIIYDIIHAYDCICLCIIIHYSLLLVLFLCGRAQYPSENNNLGSCEGCNLQSSRAKRPYEPCVRTLAESCYQPLVLPGGKLCRGGGSKASHPGIFRWPEAFYNAIHSSGVISRSCSLESFQNMQIRIRRIPFHRGMEECLHYTLHHIATIWLWLQPVEHLQTELLILFLLGAASE